MKQAYLTIDDAPSVNLKEKIDFLLKKKIPAILFCEGRHIINNGKDDVIYAVKKGFVIGNHSFGHPHFSELELDKCLDEIKRTDEIIEEIYSIAKIERPIKIFRFPYGDRGGENKEKIQDYLRSLGYEQPKFKGITYPWYSSEGYDKDVDVFWTFDNRDYQIGEGEYKENTLQDILKLIDESEKLKSDSNDIILSHDHERSHKHFKILIEAIQNKGINFISL
ncbi:MAG: polysaccharide deacetylase family protein [archaeon]